MCVSCGGVSRQCVCVREYVFLLLFTCNSQGASIPIIDFVLAYEGDKGCLGKRRERKQERQTGRVGCQLKI